MEPGTAPSRGEGLPRRRIIRSRAIFDAARTRGRRWTDRCMTLQVLPREDLSTAEVAFLTPKRLGPAVVRTRLRRRMREIYRRFLSQVAPGHYLVWVARAGAIDLDATALELCMRNLAQRVASKR